MIGAGRDRKDDAIDPAVGIILEVKTGEKVDAGAVLCRLYYTHEDRVDEAADMVEDAFRISAQKPDERNLISRSRRRLEWAVHRPAGHPCDPRRRPICFPRTSALSSCASLAGGWGCNSPSPCWY
jgi:hypothetical protein